MTIDTPQSAPLLEPDPEKWLTPQRLEQLNQQIEGSKKLLKQAGLLRAALGYWVRWEVSLEANWGQDEENTILDDLEKDWLEKSSQSEQKQTYSDNELREKLRVSPGSLVWAREQWSHRLESIYLERKSQLDQASCRLIRVRDKGIALELHHRIKAGETSFEQAAREYGQGSERRNNGLIPMQTLEKMPFGLAPLLVRLEPGRLSLPMRLGEGFCLVQLESFKPSQYDKATEELLLAEQLRLWIDSVVNYLLSVLSSEEQAQVETSH